MTHRAETELDSALLFRACFAVDRAYVRDSEFDDFRSRDNLENDSKISVTFSADRRRSETERDCGSGILRGDEFIGQLVDSTRFYTYDPFLPTSSVGIEWDRSWIRRQFIDSLHLYSLSYSQTTDERNCEVQSDSFSSEEELAAFQAKMARMQAMLENELDELHEQEIKLVTDRIVEDVQVSKKMTEMEKALENEKRELEEQERIIEIEHEMNLKYPDPEVVRPSKEAGDDSFTRAMKRVGGLLYQTEDMTPQLLTYHGLPPPLSVSKLMSVATSNP